MKVFKFGGASVKDAEGVKNVAVVLETQGFQKCLVVVSAMGKTTNALEKVVEAYFAKQDYQTKLEEIKQNHLQITQELFPENHEVFGRINEFFAEAISFLQRNKSPHYNFVYDQVVSCGEMVSSVILSEYLQEIGFQNTWCDAREYLKTDSNYREGTINWEETEKRIKTLHTEECYVTQGFIGSDENSFTVTLGREGSDYSAAIFAYCLNAEAMTIWKDVPGVMTGDPRKFENVSLLENISYEEAIEMAYYGASVIHPKTLQPLQQKNIPFFVKSFLEPAKKGTKVDANLEKNTQQSFILKENQHLLRIATRDFSFIAEEHLSLIFSLLAKHKIKISLMQNSAISLDLCLEDTYHKIDLLVNDLTSGFQTELVRDVSLYTIRNAKMEEAPKLYVNKNVLLEQVSQKILQVVIN
jgi:aspartate kinase